MLVSGAGKQSFILFTVSNIKASLDFQQFYSDEI